MLGVTSGRLKKTMNDNLIGLNQTYKKVSLSFGVNYQNTSDRTIIAIGTISNAGSTYIYLHGYINDVSMSQNSSVASNSYSLPNSVILIVPPKAFYRFNKHSSSGTNPNFYILE